MSVETKLSRPCQNDAQLMGSMCPPFSLPVHESKLAPANGSHLFGVALIKLMMTMWNSMSLQRQRVKKTDRLIFNSRNR